MSFFDSFQSAVFNMCSKTFGDVATWQPAAGGPLQSAAILFAAPTDERAAQRGIHVSQLRPEAEWYEGTFPGLRESVAAHEIERLTIGGVVYYVKNVEKLADGKTYRAALLVDKGQ